MIMEVKRGKNYKVYVVGNEEDFKIEDNIKELVNVNYNSTVFTMTKFLNLTDGFTEKFTLKFRKGYEVVEVFKIYDVKIEPIVKWSLIVLHRGKPMIMVVSCDYTLIEPDSVRIYKFSNDLYSVKLVKYIIRNRFGIYKSMLPIIEFFNTLSIIWNKNPVMFKVDTLEEKYGFVRTIGIKTSTFLNSSVVKSESYDFILNVKESWLKGLNTLMFLEDYI